MTASRLDPSAPVLTADLCVIGAGAGGLSVAVGAAQLGAATVLVERGAMGGDCLNTGCVPSKALLAAGNLAAAMRGAGRFGLGAVEPAVDFGRVHDHVHEVIASIAPHDSVERLTGLGVRVLRAEARFTGRNRLQVGAVTVTARRFVIATGSRPALPPIPGLADVPFLTNETIFDGRTAPAHLIVIGGGPVGVELAQAHRRLGCAVTLVEQATLLPRDDPELVAVVRRQLVRDGVVLHEVVAIARVEAGTDAAPGGGGVTLILASGVRLTGSTVLVAAGRRPDLESLALAAAGVRAGPEGIVTDARLRTSNRRIFALGDVVAGGPRFTHAAGYQAGVVLRNALFRWPARVDYRALPRVTCTSPELAQVGMTEAEARAAFGAIGLLRWPLAENDRARADRTPDGLVKAVIRPDGRVVGAGIVGAHAGELIQVWGLAIARGLKVGALATLIAPYPTLGEASKRAAGSYFAPRLFNDRVRGVVRLLARLG
jgi:pyruvate/2-oxoglutarate dehydrogenase complex dihydrolipoamide dehydrogenase (E3) component